VEIFTARRCRNLPPLQAVIELYPVFFPNKNSDFFVKQQKCAKVKKSGQNGILRHKMAWTHSIF
jgi:hypothetical protein